MEQRPVQKKNHRPSWHPRRKVRTPDAPVKLLANLDEGDPFATGAFLVFQSTDGWSITKTWADWWRAPTKKGVYSVYSLSLEHYEMPCLEALETLDGDLLGDDNGTPISLTEEEFERIREIHMRMSLWGEVHEPLTAKEEELLNKHYMWGQAQEAADRAKKIIRSSAMTREEIQALLFSSDLLERAKGCKELVYALGGPYWSGILYYKNRMTRLELEQRWPELRK